MFSSNVQLSKGKIIPLNYFDIPFPRKPVCGSGNLILKVCFASLHQASECYYTPYDFAMLAVVNYTCMTCTCKCVFYSSQAKYM